MHLIKILIAAVSIAFLMNLSLASTVTLSGSCKTSYVNGSEYVNFWLSNSGNGTAQGVILTGTPVGLKTNTLDNISMLGPSENKTVSFLIDNTTIPGSYAFGVYVSYTQDQQNFIVSFPCIVAIGNRTISPLVINNLSVVNDRLSARLTNIASYPINATANFINPPEIKMTPKSILLQVGPDSSVWANATVAHPTGKTETVNVALFISYAQLGQNYVTMQNQSISFGPTAVAAYGAPTGSDTLLYLLGGFILLIIVLIILSIAIKRKK